jgi:hypothetical protein
MAPLSIDDELALARRRRRSTTCRAPLCCTATRPLRVSWWPFGVQVTVGSALNSTTASRSPLPSPPRLASVRGARGRGVEVELPCRGLLHPRRGPPGTCSCSIGAGASTWAVSGAKASLTRDYGPSRLKWNIHETC